MVIHSSICRIGVFYDGSFFTYAQNHLFHDRKLGWLSFQPLHAFLETYLRQKEQTYTSHKIVYASWHQGLFTTTKATDDQLRSERRLYHDLMHAGIEPKYMPMSEQEGEKGVDVAMAVDALQIGLDGKIDIAVLVTGDADFVPLVRALHRQGIRVLAAYFVYDNGKGNKGSKGFINPRLLTSCDYEVDVMALENNKDYKTLFNGLLRKQSDWE